MYPATFEYHRPTSVAEALDLLRTRKDARVLAGGHSLLPAMKLRLAGPPALVDIGRIKELSGIQAASGGVTIGALTTHAEVAGSDLVKTSCPVVVETASRIGDLQVRNRGTLGGSLAHADPAADLPPVMLLLGAKMTAAGPAGRREIAAQDFFVEGFTTALKDGELLVSVHVPGYGKGTGAAYLKHRHPASSYAVVGVATLVELKDGKCARVGITVGGVMARPVRATAAEAALAGKTPDAAAIAAAAEKVGDAIQRPLSDLYASGEFRTHLARVLAKRALTLAAERARG
jgi:carbon-monoxide dehydrogenase medium subunit